MARIRRMRSMVATERKAVRFITAARSGHRRDSSLPLLTVIRDMLHLAEDAKEARKIIKGRMVKVDGRTVTDPKRGLGVFDVLEVGGKAYRMVPKKKRLELAESEPGSKIVQIIGKTALKGGNIQVNLNDGKNMLLKKNEYKVLDSLLISLPGQEVKAHVALEPGALVLITKGENSGKTVKLIEVERARKRVWVEENGRKFEAGLSNVMAVGKDRPLIGLGD